MLTNTPHNGGSGSLKGTRARGFHSSTNTTIAPLNINAVGEIRQGGNKSTALEGSKHHPHQRSNLLQGNNMANGIGIDKGPRSYSQNQGSRSKGISNILVYNEHQN